MIDIHSHILPGIDDGAKDIAASAGLIEQLKNQGVGTVVATPHFYTDTFIMEDFLSKREAAYNKVTDHFGGKPPVNILIGAEVLYFRGISVFSGIKQLTLAKSRYLLIELLGVDKIDDRVISDIIGISENLSLIPIIAHVERYSRYKGYGKLLDFIEESGVLCQINATFVTGAKSKRIVGKLLKRGLVDFVASDCHDPVLRPVMIDAALAEIEKTYPRQAKKIRQKTEQLEKELISANAI